MHSLHSSGRGIARYFSAFLLAGLFAFAPAARASLAPDASSSGAIDRADLNSFVDGLVTASMREWGIAGVTVAIVDRKEPLLLRGYGIGKNLPHEEPVDPNKTLFRIGSVSKTFTYLEALKLAVDGKIDLDKPANDYLPEDLAIPSEGYAPILVRHLLTHSAGFEDLSLGHLLVRDESRVPSLHDYLIAHRPSRVREPGKVAVYSNYGVALLGALLANVEKMPFEDLMERDLFTPLGMYNSTFREPLRAADPRNTRSDFSGNWSEGFIRVAGGYVDGGFEHIVHVAPAGSISSDAADMARYMRMILGDGELDGIRVLPERIFKQLNGPPLLRNAPELPGWSGFEQGRYGNVNSLEHTGVTNLFLTNMVVIPELDIGIFVSLNTANKGRALITELPTLVLERYFARARPNPLGTRLVALDADRYQGHYLGERRPFHHFEKLLLAGGAYTTVDVTPDGDLAITRDGDTTRWQHVEGELFRSGQRELKFLVDAKNQIVGFAGVGDVFDRVNSFKNPDLALILLAIAALLAVVAMLDARRQRKRENSAAPRSYVSTALNIAAISWLAFGVTFFIALFDPNIEYDYPSRAISIALWLSPVAILATVASVVLLPTAWIGTWSVQRKIWHSVVIFTFALGAYALWWWDVLGWKA